MGLVSGSSGKLMVDSSMLGFGTVLLQPVASTPIGKVKGMPIKVVISPPVGIAPVKSVPELQPGLRVHTEVGDSVISDTKDENWLKSSVRPGEKFTCEGFFKADKEGMYQMLLRTNTGCVLTISGQRLGSGNGRLQYFPVHLLPGMHKISVIGTATDNPSLDLRLGLQGCLALHQSFISCTN